MKKVLLMLMVLCITANYASAKSDELDATKSIMKKHFEAAKQDLNAQSAAKKEQYRQQKGESKKQNPVYKKKTELKEKQSAELAIINNQIKAKQDEIAVIKKMKISILEQERRIKPLESQITVLEAKKTRTYNLYQKQIDFLGK